MAVIDVQVLRKRRQKQRARQRQQHHTPRLALPAYRLLRMLQLASNCVRAGVERSSKSVVGLKAFGQAAAVEEEEDLIKKEKCKTAGNGLETRGSNQSQLVNLNTGIRIECQDVMPARVGRGGINHIEGSR